MASKTIKFPDTVSAACEAGTNDRVQQLLGPGETRSSFLRDAVMAAIESREKVFNCHDFQRDGSRVGYYCLNCGHLRMYHLAQDVRRAADTQLSNRERAQAISRSIQAAPKYDD